MIGYSNFTYDGIGNRLTSHSAFIGNHTYTPNDLNQYSSITSATGRTAVGRAPAGWTAQVAGVNASRVLEIYSRALTAAKSAVSPVYDADGNLTGDGRWTYTWDAENRLIQMETTAWATNAGHPYTLLKFAYDWQGRRISRTVWQGGTVYSPTFKNNRRWLSDGWNVITEFSAASETATTLTRLTTFIWGLDLSGTLQGAGGVGGLLVQTAVATGVNERASYDGNGNIVAWTKSTASAPTSRREYDAFGNTLVSEGATPCAFGFSTKMQDMESALYYYGYRYYDPVNGRWPSRDPIGENGGVNLYGFVGNDGICWCDYLGLSEYDYQPIYDQIIAGGKDAAERTSEGLQARQSAFDGLTKEQKVGNDRPVSGVEFAGRVCRKCNDGKFSYYRTAKKDLISGSFNHVIFALSPACDKGDVTVGTFHSHPNQADGTPTPYLSGGDPRDPGGDRDAARTGGGIGDRRIQPGVPVGATTQDGTHTQIYNPQIRKGDTTINFPPNP